MQLKTQTQAPLFSKKDFLGNAINLTDYKGKKVLLTFFRVATCPFCNMRVQELIKNYHELAKLNVEVVAFFASTKEEIEQYAGKQKPPFAMIPDAPMEIYKQYNIESSAAGMLKVMLKPLKMMQMMTSGFFNMKSMKAQPIIPADFLIDENQTIIETYYGNDFSDHIPLKNVLQWANQKK